MASEAEHEIGAKVFILDNKKGLIWIGGPFIVVEITCTKNCTSYLVQSSKQQGFHAKEKCTFATLQDAVTAFGGSAE